MGLYVNDTFICNPLNAAQAIIMCLGIHWVLNVKFEPKVEPYFNMLTYTLKIATVRLPQTLNSKLYNLTW